MKLFLKDKKTVISAKEKAIRANKVENEKLIKQLGITEKEMGSIWKDVTNKPVSFILDNRMPVIYTTEYAEDKQNWKGNSSWKNINPSTLRTLLYIYQQSKINPSIRYINVDSDEIRKEIKSFNNLSEIKPYKYSFEKIELSDISLAYYNAESEFTGIIEIEIFMDLNKDGRDLTGYARALYNSENKKISTECVAAYENKQVVSLSSKDVSEIQRFIIGIRPRIIEQCEEMLKNDVEMDI